MLFTFCLYVRYVDSLSLRIASDWSRKVWIAGAGDKIISHGKAVSRILNAVVGKFPIQHLREGFEHHVLVSICMVVVSDW